MNDDYIVFRLWYQNVIQSISSIMVILNLEDYKKIQETHVLSDKLNLGIDGMTCFVDILAIKKEVFQKLHENNDTAKDAL